MCTSTYTRTCTHTHTHTHTHIHPCIHTHTHTKVKVGLEREVGDDGDEIGVATALTETIDGALHLPHTPAALDLAF